MFAVVGRGGSQPERTCSERVGSVCSIHEAQSRLSWLTHLAEPAFFRRSGVPWSALPRLVGVWDVCIGSAVTKGDDLEEDRDGAGW